MENINFNKNNQEESLEEANGDNQMYREMEMSRKALEEFSELIDSDCSIDQLIEFRNKLVNKDVLEFDNLDSKRMIYRTEVQVVKRLSDSIDADESLVEIASLSKALTDQGFLNDNTLDHRDYRTKLKNKAYLMIASNLKNEKVKEAENLRSQFAELNVISSEVPEYNFNLKIATEKLGKSV